jgi:type 2 lantibiotic biosynthesis protein LanM
MVGERWKSPKMTGDWRSGLTLAERFDALALTARPLQKSSRRARIHWREERRPDIARVRKRSAQIAAEPQWWQEFSEIYRAAAATSIKPAPEPGFLAALAPIIARAAAPVRSQLSRSAASLLPNSGEPLHRLMWNLEQTLRERLLLAVSKALVLELGVASRANLLKGGTSAERFAFFCDCLQDPEFARSLLAQYPVLVRRCMAITAGWELATRDLLSRIAASEQKLMSIFFDNKLPGPLTAAAGSGDVHRRGQAVQMLTFESGTQLVYKPRPVAMERSYYELIAWLNDHGAHPKLRVIRTHDEGTFGWTEFVPFAPCRAPEEVNRFFARIGAHLALAYVLGGTDLHWENIIANGEYPVPVDLETLFHTEPLPDKVSGATARAWAELQGSVMRTLVLPVVGGFTENPEDWIDVSALGQTGNQLTPTPVAGWTSAETDRMRLIYRRARLPPGLSLPQFAGQQVKSAAYTDDVVRGFAQAHEFLRKFKAALLAPQGPLAAFAGKPVRRVLRDTQTYVLTLFASYHPRFQRDAIACEAMLRDALRATSSEERNWLRHLEESEVADLLACDVPCFFSTVGSNDVVGTEGHKAISFTSKAPPRARIETINEGDLERQIWLIRVAMQDPSQEAVAPPIDADAPCDPPSAETLIGTAARIGDRICELAIEDGDRCTWLVPVEVNSRRLATTVAGFDLYNGLSGIALFLAHLGIVTGEARYRRTAEAATREALSLCRRERVDSARVGALQGVGGLAYALVHLAAILDRGDLAEEASAIVRRFARQGARTTDLDLMTGLAGFVVSGLVVARFNHDNELVEKLRPAVQRLYRLTTSRHHRHALAIVAESEAGLAHGRSGAGLALLR